MKRSLLALVFLALSPLVFSQFEPKQDTGREFEKLKIKVGGDFALQYQILNHEADSALIPLGTGFNLPTANLNLDVELASGVKLNLVTYLSARHHNEAWVKGGSLTFDKLPFLNSAGIDRLMDYLTITVGDMEINYGDAHFRRSDNGNVIRNRFVGNYIMDAFTTAPALEVLFRHKGIIAMGAVTTGDLRQDLVRFTNNTYTKYDAHKELGFYWKLGYEKEWKEEFNTRLTVSGYHMPKENHNSTLYNGDRTGSRYYLIMNKQNFTATDVDIKSNHTSGNWGPGSATKTNSYMVNLFAQAKGIELFGTFESAKGLYATGNEFSFSQVAGEGLYFFGGNRQFYGGLRYDLVHGDINTGAPGDQSVSRIQIAAGWFILESVVLKMEYVNQKYHDFIAEYGADAGFNGVIIEAAVTF